VRQVHSDGELGGYSGGGAGEVKNVPVWASIVIYVVCGAGIAVAAYHLFSFKNVYDVISVALLLAAWLGAWLFYQRLKKNPPGGNSN
jgi:hypothetical protein